MKVDFDQAIEYFYNQLPMFHRIGAAAYKNNLDNTLALSSLFGHPEQQFLSVHVAGTNGKGSVSNMLASILQESGYKTGLFTSPHLKDFRERIRINGKMIPKNEIASFVSKHKADFMNLQPSFFELTFALAMKYFARQKVDIAVVETGMGGRLDSTNIVKPVLTIITNISFDHMQFLGNTLPLIAKEKVGIIKKGIPVLIGKTQNEVKFVFDDAAKLSASGIYYADAIYKTLDLAFSYYKPYGSVFSMMKDGKLLFKDLYTPLSGNYQKENLQTVFAAIDILRKNGINIDESGLIDGIANAHHNTGLKGRWQVLADTPLTICDTAHNEAGIRFILEQIEQLRTEKLHFVLGMVNDKDYAKILSLLPTTANYYFCKPNIPRGLDQEVLRREATKFRLKGKAYTSVMEALNAARLNAKNEDLIFISGSTYVVAEVV
jgi:dihydrofolate synthase / folylpolyglutamate synthase